MKRKTGKNLIIVCIALTIVVAVLLFLRRTPYEEMKPRVGDIAPAIHLTDLSGHMVRLSDYEDKVVLINFWASWCPPCKTEMEWFQRAYEEYGNRGFMVVAISLDNVSAELLLDLGLTFPVMVANDRVKKAYGGIMDVPVSFLVGKDGTVIRKVKKVYPENDLRTDIEAAL